MIVQDARGLYLRDDTRDDMIAHEVYDTEDYAELVLPGCLALDIGGHIGLTARYLIEHGMRVVSVEPDPDNRSVHRLNAPTAVLLEGAVAGHTGEVSFYRSGLDNKAISSLWPKRNCADVLTVSCWSLPQLLQVYDPVALKIDIEGGEYLLNWSYVNPALKRIAIEMHTSRREWREQSSHELNAMIVHLGFECTRDFYIAPRGKWPKVFSYRRSTA